jgi:ATP adenylyltransferase
MDRLWAPWRIEYLTGKKRKCCIFCKAAKHKSSDYVFLKTAFSIAMLNIYPYNNGHVLISPARHVKDFNELKGEEALDLFDLLNRSKELLSKVLKPDGFNIGINLSRSAGAGIDNHMHIHIVPRWKGDTNFMPVFNNTRVISQSLDELFKLLKKNVKSK